MKQLLFLLITLLPACNIILAQNNRPLRVEIPTRSGTDPFNYITCGEQGVCVFYPTIGETGKDSISWSIVMYDKNLREIWRKQVPLHEDVSFLKGISTEQSMYLLFHDTKRNTEGNIFIFMIIPSLRVITEHRSAIPDKAEVTDFEILDDLALVGYNQRKGKPEILGFSLVSGDKRTYTVNSDNDALLLDVAVDTLYREVYATYKEQLSSSKNRLFVSLFDKSAALRSSTEFDNIQERRIINSAQFMPTGRGRGVVAGTYGYGARNTRKPYDYYNDYYNYYYYYNYNYYMRRMQNYDSNRDQTPDSDGFFSAPVTVDSRPAIEYHSFIDFANAYRYLTDMEALRTRRKAEKRNKEEELSVSEEKNYSLNYKLIVHEVKAMQGRFILAAEAYAPEYHTMTQMIYDIYGRPIPSTYSVFDGFRYANAFVAAFDSSGKMAFSNGMEMRDVLTQYLNRKLSLTDDNGELILFYNANGKLSYKVIDKENIVENTTVIKIAPLRETDQHASEYLGTIEHWYDGFFLATGYETIRNNSISENKRNVFYLCKLAYE